MRRYMLLPSLGALLLCAGTAFAQDHLKVAVGARGVGETFVSELGQNAGIFKKHGLALEVLYTQGAGETQQVVISNSAQIGVATGFLGALGAFAKGAPVRIIGSTFTGGAQMFWYVPANSPIRSLKDTEGKTVAYSTNGSSSHTAVLALQRSSGVKFTANPSRLGSLPNGTNCRFPLHKNTFEPDSGQNGSSCRLNRFTYFSVSAWVFGMRPAPASAYRPSANGLRSV